MITMSTLGKNGAMGNQLFQYAALYGISQKTGYKMKIPPLNNDATGKLTVLGGNFKDGVPFETYEYSLGCFMVTSEYLTTGDILSNHKQNILSRIIQKLNHSKEKFIYHSYEEPYFHFDPNVFDMKDGTDIYGYFQSEKYFSHCLKEIRKDGNISLRFELPWTASTGNTYNIEFAFNGLPK